MNALLFVLTLLAAMPTSVPDLTDAQRQVLATAADDAAHVDEPALYPLLQNALHWTPGDETGAMVPSYDRIMANPADHRGQIFLIEGKLAAPPRKMNLARPIELNKPDAQTPVEQWNILLPRKNADAADEVVVVYVVNPPADSPRVGTDLRMAARFFKTWQTTTRPTRDEAGQPARFGVFVTGPPELAASEPVSSDANLRRAMIVAAVLIGASFLLIRRSMKLTLKPKPLSTRLGKRFEDDPSVPHDADENVGDGAERSALPDDPAAALDELRSRRNNGDA